MKHNVRLTSLGLLVASTVITSGCSAPREPTPEPAASSKAGERPMSIKITTPAFSEGQPIPKRHSEDGEDLSPTLSWSSLPADTKELALVVDDPDAPRTEPWVHWLIYKIPADADGLKEGVPQQEKPSSPTGAVQGKNSWGTVGYRGPAPPKGHGTHHYHFKLYALDAALDLKPGLDKHELLNAISGHVLGQGEMVGTYQR